MNFAFPIGNPKETCTHILLYFPADLEIATIFGIFVAFFLFDLIIQNKSVPLHLAQTLGVRGAVALVAHQVGRALFCQATRAKRKQTRKNQEFRHFVINSEKIVQTFKLLTV